MPIHRLRGAAIAALTTALTGVTHTAQAGLNEWSGAGPEGGRATRVLMDSANPDRAYALGAGAGLFVSDDGGASWAPLAVDAPGITERQISDVAVDPNAPANLFVADNGTEVARSVDGGQTWTTSSDGITASIFYLFAGRGRRPS